MNKLIASALVVVALFGASIASAQTCVSITSDLSVGSRGSQVTNLQNFLVSQNYPGGGSWMVTGYYGQATAAAVRNFQQTRGLPTTGVVDAATRAAINSASCGYLSAPATVVSNPFTYNYSYSSTLNTYPYVYSYPYPTGTLSITSMSQNTGVPGDTVTLYGTGFDPINNIVYFGTQAVSGVSSNGTSITFVVPSLYSYAQNQNVELYVSNSRGTSNRMTFTLYPYGTYYPYNQFNQYPCSTYAYGGSYGCGCAFGGYGCGTTSGIPVASYLSPTSGTVGTWITVFGSGFSTTGNSVHFGNGIISNLNSPDGRSVSFVVPAQLTGFGSQAVVAGTYNISVTNSAGLSSNTLPFTVSSVSTGIAPSITSVNGPTTLQSGVQGTWTLVVNNPGGSYLTASVNWGDATVYGASTVVPQTVYSQGQTTLTFTHTYYANGTYAPTFTVSNASAQQNSASASVVVSGSGSYTPVTISYLSPSSGARGTQIAITGSGFSTYDNTVHFGIGGTQHLPSVNGTTIYYTIPWYVSPCDLATPGTLCTQNVQQLVPGPVQLYVTNASGSSNVLTFQVI